MPYILNALWNTFELWNTHELIIMINASTGIKKRKKKEKEKIGLSLHNTRDRIRNSRKHFLFSPRFNSIVCNKGCQKRNHST